MIQKRDEPQPPNIKAIYGHLTVNISFRTLSSYDGKKLRALVFYSLNKQLILKRDPLALHDPEYQGNC